MTCHSYRQAKTSLRRWLAWFCVSRKLMGLVVGAPEVGDHRVFQLGGTHGSCDRAGAGGGRRGGRPRYRRAADASPRSREGFSAVSGTATAPRRVSGKTGASGVGSDADLRRELRSYRRLCREIDRLLAADRLSEARRLNDEARALFQRLYGSSSGLKPPGAASRRGSSQYA